MYDVYIDDMLLPINPEKITMKINGKNESATLINDGEVSVLKSPGLTDVNFNVIFPNVRYPFIHYADSKKSFHNAKYYLDKLKVLKEKKVAFQFIVARRFPMETGKSRLFSTNLTCSLENYQIIDDARNGFDTEVQIVLRQFKPYSTKTFNVDRPSARAPIVVKTDRSASTAATKNKQSSGGKNGNRGGLRTYKVSIPGMSVLSIKAGSVQEAITKAMGDTWTGDVYVDGKAYYVIKGVLSEKPEKKVDPPPAVKKAAEKVTNAVSSGIQAVGNGIQAVTNTLASLFRQPTKIEKPAAKNLENEMRLTR